MFQRSRNNFKLQLKKVSQKCGQSVDKVWTKCGHVHTRIWRIWPKFQSALAPCLGRAQRTDFFEKWDSMGIGLGSF